MTHFQEIKCVLEAARAVLQNRKAARQFVELLEKCWGGYRDLLEKQGEIEAKASKLKAKLPPGVVGFLNPSWPRGDIYFKRSKPLKGAADGVLDKLPEKDALARTYQPIPVRRHVLNAGAALLRAHRNRWQHVPSARWENLSDKERSHAWKLAERRIVGESRASALARRGELVRWTQLAVLALGGGLLTFSTSGERTGMGKKRAGYTLGVQLVSAVLDHLGMPTVGDKIIAREIEAIRKEIEESRLWASRIKQLRKSARARKKPRS